jgi:HEPN domain-containing protein
MKQITLEWLDRAAEDFDLAEELFAAESRFKNSIAFLAQQASEKYLKSLLIENEIEFRKTHSLPLLIELLLPAFPTAETVRHNAELLTPYAVASRYPGLQVTELDIQPAIESARAIRKFVTAHLTQTHGA